MSKTQLRKLDRIANNISMMSTDDINYIMDRIEDNTGMTLHTKKGVKQ